MARTRRPFFGARRSRFGTDRRKQRRSSERRQRVRFRRRYVAARLRTLGELAWIAGRLAVIAAVLAWSLGFAWNAIHSSDYLRVRDVRYVGDIPAKLSAALPLRSGIGLFSFSASALSTGARQKFPELESLSIHRGLDRTVYVHGKFRTPVAVLFPAPAPTGIDSSGVAFPLRYSASVSNLPAIDAPARDRAAVLACLDAWRRKLPEFFVMVKKLETDKMHLFHVELSDGVSIEWGELEPPLVVGKARNVLRLRSQFSPSRVPAKLRFVTVDRIVMDANWQPSGKTNEGGPIVKT